MKLNFAALITAALLLTGCAGAPQLAVPFSAKSVEGSTNRVAVVMTKLPVVDTQFPGAGCLLCLAAASVANSELTKHTKTLSYEDFPQLKEQVANALRKKGAVVTVIAEPLDISSLASSNGGVNVAPKDFASLREKFQADKLVVIDIREMGFARTYSAYFPTSEPKANISGTSFMVNLKDNSYEWFAPLAVMKGSEKWDEPPKYPGLTNAYYQALEQAKDDITKPLIQ